MAALKNVLVWSSFVFLNFATALPYLDPALARTLRHGKTANILVTFRSGIDAQLEAISRKHFPSRAHRINHIAHVLQRNAKSIQAGVDTFLRSFVPPLEFESFWISNQVFIKSVTWPLVQGLMTLQEVSDIHEEEFIRLDSPVHPRETISSRSGPEWNLKRIQTPEAWSLGYLGENVLVGNIDSGVLHTHESLRGNYVGPQGHGWYDPYHETSEPNDQNGHGTHTMGIMAGNGGIGVAPKSRWLACKGCYHDLCSSVHLIKCGQFMLCPTLPDFTNPDCSKAPHVINCSWGGGRNNMAYHPVINAWKAAGITPVFSNGNTGPKCNTARSPADHPGVFGIGATTDTDEVADYSGLGPTQNGTIKPDFMAPGTGILSSTNSGDSDYEIMKGTSMSAPHVAGTIAILKGAKPDIQFESIFKYLKAGVSRNLNLPGKNCGDIPESQFPNHAVGYGRINVLNSLKALLEQE